MATLGRTSAALLGLLAVGCAGRRLEPVTATWPPEVSAAAHLESLRQRADEPILFDGTIRVQGEHRGKRISARAVAVVGGDSRFYLEAVGRPSFVLACDGTTLVVLFGESREWLQAPATEASLHALLGLDVTPGRLAGMLAGLGASGADLRHAAVDARGRIRLVDGWLQLEPGGEVVEGRWGDVYYRHEPEARQVHISVARSELDLKILRRPSTRPAAGVDAGLFRPLPPAGFRQLQLAELVQPVLLPGDEP